MSGKEFLKSVDQVFDSAAKVLKLSPQLAKQIKYPTDNMNNQLILHPI